MVSGEMNVNTKKKKAFKKKLPLEKTLKQMVWTIWKRKDKHYHHKVLEAKHLSLSEYKMH